VPHFHESASAVELRRDQLTAAAHLDEPTRERASAALSKAVHDPLDEHYRLTDAASDLDRQLRQLDLVFVLDATGSMGWCIDEVRQRLKDLLTHLAGSSAGPRIAVGVGSYRDHPPQDGSYVTRWSPLGTAEAAQGFLDETEAEGGGDDPEAMIDGLLDGIERAIWRQRSVRILVIVADAPPHGIGHSGDGFPSGCPCERTLNDVVAAARKASVRLFTVAVGEERSLRRTFKSLAQATDGRVTTIDRLESMIDPILELLDTEMGSLEDELVLLADLASGITPREAAAGSGLALDSIATALGHLREKHAVTPIRRAETELTPPPSSPWWKERISSLDRSVSSDPAAPPANDWWRVRSHQ
jgi:Mg-chelatase subunit ChlD